MEFRLTDEQYMVRESAQAFLADVSSPQQVREAMTQAASYDPAVWQRLCNELCLQAITIPEEYGGLGMSYVYLVRLFWRQQPLLPMQLCFLLQMHKSSSSCLPLLKVHARQH